MFNIIEKIKNIHNKELKKMYCLSSVVQAFINPNGNVYVCPDCMVNNSDYAFIGNINKNSIDKIWNSQYAKEIRNSIKNRSYSNCILAMCANKTNFHMQVLNNFLKNNSFDYNLKSPKIVTFGSDVKGFFNCKMATDEDCAFLSSDLKEKYIKSLKNVSEVSISYDFDPFSSYKISELIKEISDKYENIKFNIVSNGVLFNRENCDKLNISNKLSNVLIFVNAANKQSYDEFVHNGDFDIIKQNISYLSSLKKENKLANVFIAFVIDESNFEQIPAFVELAKETSTHALFWLKYTNKPYFLNNANTFLSKNSELHNKLVEILKSNKFDDENSSIAYVLKNLINS